MNPQEQTSRQSAKLQDLTFLVRAGEIESRFNDLRLLWTIDAYTPPHPEFTRVNAEAEVRKRHDNDMIDIGTVNCN